jgi:hypothetical protein
MPLSLGGLVGLERTQGKVVRRHIVPDVREFVEGDTDVRNLNQNRGEYQETRCFAEDREEGLTILLVNIKSSSNLSLAAL